MTTKKLIELLIPYYSPTSTMPSLVAKGKRIPNYKKVMLPLYKKENIPLEYWEDAPKYLEKEEEEAQEQGEANTSSLKASD